MYSNTSIYTDSVIEIMVLKLVSGFKGVFLPTYLYVKKHKKTGLLYFGKTTRDDPLRYNGSGTHWTRHYKIHGVDQIETIFLKHFTKLEDCIRYSITFSIENDIINSKFWANHALETGIGGGYTGVWSNLGPDSPYYDKGSIYERYDLNKKLIDKGTINHFKKQGFSDSNIVNCSNGKQKTYKKSYWKKENDKNFLFPPKEKLNSKIIQQFSMDVVLIREGYIDIFKNMGFEPSNISRCCNYKIKHHKGYIFRYKA